VLDWLAKRSGLPKETRDYVRIVTGVPAEHWINARLQRGELQVPRRVPCDQVASASELPSPPQAAKSAGSRLRHAAPAVEYMRAASPSPTPSIRLTRLARHDNVTSRDRRGAGVVRMAELKTQAKRGAEDRKVAGVVRTADLRMRVKPGHNDRKGGPAVRLAELKTHAKRGGDKRRAS
jgi:hypothetical protein